MDVAAEFDSCNEGVVDGVNADSNGNNGISGLGFVFFLTKGVTIGSKLYFLYVPAVSDDDDDEDDEEDEDEDDDDDIIDDENGTGPPSASPLFLLLYLD